MGNFTPQNYYEILGVDRNATQGEIRAMYRKLAKIYHADANSSDPALAKWSQDRMAELNEAYEVLGDPVRRKRYDEGRGGPGGPSHDEAVHIDTWDKARAVLLDGVRQYPLKAESAAAEKDARKEMERLVRKRAKKYLWPGVPQDYPMSYLSYVVDSIAGDAILRINERAINGGAMITLIVATALLGIIAAFWLSEGILQGAWKTVQLVILNALQFQFTYCVAHFVARGFESNLGGTRGRIVNAAILLLFMGISVVAIFFPQH